MITIVEILQKVWAHGYSALSQEELNTLIIVLSLLCTPIFSYILGRLFPATFMPVAARDIVVRLVLSFVGFACIISVMQVVDVCWS